MIHTVAGTEGWDAIDAMCSTHPDCYIASQNRPLMTTLLWCQNISEGWYPDGAGLAAAIAGGLDRDDKPSLVMVDEVRANSAIKIASAADILRTNRPDLMGLWGAYLVNGEGVDYIKLQPAIDSLLRANALIAPEFYPKQSRYCVAATTVVARDAWLSNFFRGSRGSFPQARLHYLMGRLTSLVSTSRIIPIFGVTSYMDGPSPAAFLDRMFYVFRNLSGYGGLLTIRGGAGSWKWDVTAGIPDDSYVASWEWYCADKLKSSRLRQVRCS